MIKKLQQRFILISMLSILLVLTIIMGTINILNFQKVAADADQLLYFLSINNGAFPKDIRPGNPKHKIPPELQRFKSFPMSPEIPYETRYFSVVLETDGTVHSVNTGKIAAIDNEEASEYAAKIWDLGRTSGFLSQYRYRMDPCPEGFRLL